MKSYNEPNYLYHFTRTLTALKYILPNKTIRMNKAINVTDPKDILHHILNQNNSIQIKWVASKLQKISNVLCFSIDKEKKAYERARMWAQHKAKESKYVYPKYSNIVYYIKVEKFIKYQFLKKNDDLVDEAEYRFINFTKDREIYVSINNSLDRIILGLNFPKSALILNRHEITD